MKKHLLLTVLLFCYAFLVRAQQDSSIIWTVTGGTGNVYTVDLKDCSTHFQYHTGGSFWDIAHTPNGNLYANSPDTLYQLYANGYIRPIGAIPTGKGLVGLNDSTLLIDSLEYLVSVKTSDASTHLIGRTGYRIDGDLTWIGKTLYTIGRIKLGGDTIGASYLVKIQLNDNYTQIQNIDTFRLDINNAYYTPALVTEYTDSLGYMLVALPGNKGKYKVDTSTGVFTLICNSIIPDSAYGASCMIFPPNPPSTAIVEIQTRQPKVNIFPNPSHDEFHIQISDFEGALPEIQMQFYDYTGRLLMAKNLKSNNEEINISNYSLGLYLVKLIYKNKNTFIQKIIKK